MTAYLLTINGGSSSIKFALFTPGEPPARVLSGKVDRIGLSDVVFSAKGTVIGEQGPAGQSPVELSIQAANHEQAAEQLIAWLAGVVRLDDVTAVGHRVVHGGPRYGSAQLVTAELIAELKRIASWDPDHLPAEIRLIEICGRRFSNRPQVACFDTAFHHDLPRVAQILPVPRRFEAMGVRRYGFHGLSYSYLLSELARLAGPDAARGRVILAHLGAGASLAAVRDGKCVDTTMAFTPTAGLVMATRSGDLDPGLLVYLMREEHMTVDQIDELVNRQSGLLGISETSPDMRDLLARQAADSRAADAVALFCQQTKKWIGAFAAVLGGLDTLVFAGGIGENAAEIRARICQGLDFLGIELDESRNAAHAVVLSTDRSRTTVRMIRTDEEAVIAAEIQRIAKDRFPS